MSGPSHLPAAQGGPENAPAGARGDQVRLTAWVRGRVQGVGFRWWTRSQVRALGLVGAARNLDDGRVEVIAEGHRAACEQLLALLRSDHAPGRVDAVDHAWSTASGDLSGFRTG